MSMTTRTRRRQDEEELEFPCLQCGKEVRPRQQALECDSCSRWQHRLCNTGITLQQYRAAMKEGIDWTCSGCSLQAMNSDDEVASIVSQFEPIGESSRLSSMDQSHVSTIPENSLHSDDGQPLANTYVINDSSIVDQAEQSLTSDDEQPLGLTYVINNSIVNQAEQTLPPDEEQPLELTYVINDSSIVDQAEQSLTSDEEQPLDLTYPNNNSSDDSSIIDQATIYQVLEGSSQRRQRVLLDSHGYSYGVKRTNANRTLWRCSVRNSEVKCSSTVIQQGMVYTPGLHRHIHPPKHAEVHRRLLHKELKIQAKRQPLAGGMEIAEGVLLQRGLTYPARTATLKRMANRVREADRPKEPRTLDFDLNENFLPDDFLVADVTRGGHRSLIYATPQQLQLLRQAQTWFVDGTFKVVRLPFYQLLVVHAYYEVGASIKQVALAYILMSSKRSGAYREAMQELRDALPGPAAVEEIMVDFEAALWKVLPRIFPQARLVGCNFHWKQAVFRRVQAVGLTAAYTTDDATRTLLQKVMALPFLPLNEVVPAFQLLRQQSSTPPLDELFAYVETTWINGRTWPVGAWNVYGRSIRTNNCAEGYNHRLTVRAGGKSMGPYQLAALLFREAQLVDMTVRLVNRHLITRRQRQMTRTLQARVFRAWECHRTGDMTTPELLSVCARTYGTSHLVMHNYDVKQGAEQTLPPMRQPLELTDVINESSEVDQAEQSLTSEALTDRKSQERWISPQENFLPEDFLIADVNRGGRSLIFATQQQLQLLSRARMWFIDATFQVVRVPFYQLLVIHAYHENGGSIKQVPLAYVLMSSKRKAAYRGAFQDLKSALPGPAAVEEIMIDFEAALWKVLPRCFPQARLSGCNFHWKQAVFRKIQALGLAAMYTRDEEKRLLLQQVMALPFLPIAEVVPAFEQLRQQSDTPSLDELFVYVERTWLQNQTWPIAAWCMYGKAIRTNNNAEGYNNRLSRKAGGRSMGPYQLAGLLYREALLTDLTVRMVDRHLITRRQRQLTRTMQARVFRAWEAHRDGEKTAQELLQVCALTYGHAP
eukprot:XP_011683859.1 PREDICTED: uncharacterized protein LOC100890943 [Strongylocentrotus purpuratus]